MISMPGTREITMSRMEFELYLTNLRCNGARTITDVDFTRVSEEQCLRILDVLFSNQKKENQQ